MLTMSAINLLNRVTALPAYFLPKVIGEVS